MRSVPLAPALVGQVPRLDGFDVAGTYQPNFPWQWSRKQGHTLAAFKATQNTSFVDTWFAKNRAVTEQLGFRYRGIYHWLTPGVEIAAQLAHFEAVIGDLRPGEFIQLDEEQSPLSLDECVEACELFSGRYPGRVAHYGGAFFGGYGHVHPRLRPWPWWLAWYGPSTLPKVPVPPVLWQWGGSIVPGMPKLIDSNQIIQPAQLELLAGYDPTPPEALDMFLIQIPGQSTIAVVGGQGSKRIVPAALVEPVTRKLGSTLLDVTADEWAAFPEKSWGGS